MVREATDVRSAGRWSVGVCQTLALIPGVSRSGATIVGGMLMGLDRRAAAEFSFFLAMPTMAAAFVHSGWAVRDQLSADRALEIAVGFVMAFLAALVVVKPFLSSSAARVSRRSRGTALRSASFCSWPSAAGWL